MAKNHLTPPSFWLYLYLASRLIDVETKGALGARTPKILH